MVRNIQHTFSFRLVDSLSLSPGISASLFGQVCSCGTWKVSGTTTSWVRIRLSTRATVTPGYWRHYSSKPRPSPSPPGPSTTTYWANMRSTWRRCWVTTSSCLWTQVRPIWLHYLLRFVFNLILLRSFCSSQAFFSYVYPFHRSPSVPS